MELEGDVQGRQDQAQKIINMPQRDRETSTSENQPSSPCMGRKSQAFLASISN